MRSSSGLSKTLCRGRDADIVAELPWNGTDKSAVESGSGSGCDSPPLGGWQSSSAGCRYRIGHKRGILESAPEFYADTSQIH